MISEIKCVTVGDLTIDRVEKKDFNSVSIDDFYLSISKSEARKWRKVFRKAGWYNFASRKVIRATRVKFQWAKPPSLNLGIAPEVWADIDRHVMEAAKRFTYKFDVLSVQETLSEGQP